MLLSFGAGIVYLSYFGGMSTLTFNQWNRHEKDECVVLSREQHGQMVRSVEIAVDVDLISEQFYITMQ